jgi:O-methyltransferase involved in polyketide biosynthesis
LKKDTKLLNVKIGDVAATSFLTLYCHAIESQSKDPILVDPKSVEITHELSKILSGSNNNLYKNLIRGKIDKQLVVHIATRAKQYDKYACDFINKYPEGVIINIGCGLDSRFLRIDNKKVVFYDLDLPEVIEIKKQFFNENIRYHFIPSSVLDYSWMRIVSKHKGPFLFIAEGVFMYLEKKDVKSLVLKLQLEFPGSELVCEVTNSLWLKKPLSKIMNLKMQQQLHLGKDTIYGFGISNSREMEEWHSGIQFLDDWYYLNSEEKKLGWLKMFKSVELFRKTQWTVHYKLN